MSDTVWSRQQMKDALGLSWTSRDVKLAMRVRRETLEEVARAIRIYGVVPCFYCGDQQKRAMDYVCSECGGRGWERQKPPLPESSD